MVAIVGGNRLGLNLGSLAALGQRGMFGAATQGRSGERAYVNVSTGDLVLQDLDTSLIGLGPDAAALRTYNSQGEWGGEWDHEEEAGWRGVTKAVRQIGRDVVRRTDSDGAECDYVWDGAQGLFVASLSVGSAVDTIRVNADGTYTWTDGATGAQERYGHLEDGVLRAPCGSGGGDDHDPALILSSSDTSGNTLTYAYDEDDRVVRVTTADGESVDFTYGTGDEAEDRLLRVTTTLASGAVLKEVSYGYDEEDRLTSVSVDLDPQGVVPPGSEGLASYVTRYTYDGDSDRVATITQSDGSSLAFTYVKVEDCSDEESAYRVASVTDGAGQLTRFAYDRASGTTTVTDPLGVSTVYQYDAEGQLTRVRSGVTAANANGLSELEYTYNALGDVTSMTDGLGNTVAMEYDARGNLTRQVDGAGNTLVRTYDSRNQLLTETIYATPAGGSAPASEPQTTRYVYDAGGRNLLRFVVTPEGRVTEHRYDAHGQRTSTIQYAGNAYDASALGAFEPPTEAQMQAWTAAQDLTRTERTDVRYDFRGAIQAVTTYSAADAAGEGLADTGTTTHYVYDHRGQLLQTVTPDGRGIVQWIYDGLGRVVFTVSKAADGSLSNTTVTQCDDANAKTTVTLANGLVTTSAFDKAGRLVSVVQSSTAGDRLGDTRYFYDADGRLLMTEDPTGQRSWRLYDAAGRKVADVDPAGGLTEYVYDANNQITETIAYDTPVDTARLVDANGLPTTGYNPNPSAAPSASVTLDAIRPAASALDSRAWSFYDHAGRLVWQVDALGFATHTEYDGASRVQSVTRFATLVDTGRLGDGGGVTLALAGDPSASTAAVTVARDPADRTVTRIYDRDGLLRAVIDGEGYLTETRYDAARQPVETIAYAKKVPGFTDAASISARVAAARTADSLAGLLPGEDPGDVRTFAYYNARGQKVAEVDGEGYLTETVYTANGQVERSIRYANAARAAPTVTSTLPDLRPASDREDQVVVDTWDALGRLSTQTNGEGTITKYLYDVVGHLTHTTVALDTSDRRTVIARYDVQGRVTAELSAEGAALITGAQTADQIEAIWAQYATTYSYDAAGRRTSSTDANGSRTVLFYDEVGRLRFTVNALGEVSEKVYDALGHLTATSQYATRLAAGTVSALAGGVLSAPANRAAAAALAAAKGASAEADSTTRYGYDADGRLVSTTDAEQGVSTRTYDAFGDAVRSTQAIDATRTRADTATFDRRGLRTVSVGDAGDASHVNATTRAEYDAFGRLVRAYDANGNAPTRQVFDRLGRVVQIVDPTDASRSTTYDAFGRVLTQRDALGHVTSYAYDSRARSVTVTTPENVTVTTVHNREGQTRIIVDGNGNTTTYDYDANGNLRRTSTPLDATTTVETENVYDHANRLVATIDANGTTVAYAYDAANRLLTRTVDPGGLGLVTRYAYDAKGRQVRATDPNGVVTETTYDLKGEVLTQTVDPGGLALRTTYTYDARGRQLTVESPGGTTTRYVYDELGRRLQTIVDPDGLALTQTYAYDRNGNAVRTAVDLGGGAEQVTRYLYDADNRLTATVDGEGGVTKTTYDANGNVTERRTYANRIDLASWQPGTEPGPVADDAHDLRVRTAYDRMNRARFTVDGTGAVVEQRYDGDSNVIERIAYAERIPVGTGMTEEKLSAAAAAIADPGRDGHIRRVYDALNRLAWSVDGLGEVTRQVYDGNGNLVKQVAYANTIGASDAPSGVVASGADRVSYRAYDRANRLRFQVDAMGGVQEQAYDADGHVVQRIAYGARIAAPATGADAPSAEQVEASLRGTGAGADANRVNRAVYDAAGRMVFGVDASGAVTESRYDANGNVLATTAYAKQIDASALPVLASADDVRAKLAAAAGAAIAVSLADGAGEEAVQASAGDRTTLRAYDAANRLVYTVDALGYVKHDTYDGAGRVKTTTLFASPVAGLSPGATAAEIAAAIRASDATDETDAFDYDRAGNLVASTDALGGTESYAYNGAGDKLTFTNKKGATWTYDYDAAGRLVRETTPEVELTAVAQDAAGNLVQGAQSSAAAVTRLEYDGLGNLTSRTEAEGRAEERTTRYRYDALGRQVETVFPDVGVYDPESPDALAANGATGTAARTETTRTLSTRTFYDVFGDAVASTDVAGNTSYKAYDALGRVSYEIDALGFVTGYERNAFGDATRLTRYAAAPVLGGSPAAPPAAAAVAHALTAVDHAADRVIVTEYDAQGRAVQVNQPEAWVFDGNGRSYAAAAVVKNAYDAFGQRVQTAVLVDKGATPAADVWATTTHYFDRRGQETASVDAMGYVTTRRYDAAGNLVRQTEYAARTTAASTSTLELPARSTDPDAGYDRTVISAYDRLNRKISDTRIGVEYSAAPDGTSVRGDLATTYGYDAVGNLTRTSQALGDGTFATTYTYYDALGRTTAVAAPTRGSTADGSSLTPLTLFARDAYGNVLVKTELARGAGSADEKGFTRGAPSGDDRATLAAYDRYGHVVQTTDAEGASGFVSYDAAGHVAKQWQGVTTDDAAENGSFRHTLYTVFEYDTLGRQTAVVTPASTSVVSGDGITIVGQQEVGSVKTTMEYDAFGEMVRRASAGSGAPADAESFEYDGAGRLWRTNSGDGNVKVMLYDLLGRQTATITSAGSAGTAGLGVDLGDRSAITSARQVDGMDPALLRRTDSKLDLLGRLVKQTLPSRQDPWTPANALGDGDAPGSLSAPYRPAVTQTFDRWGNVLTQSDVRNAEWITRFRYNANNQVVEEIQPHVAAMGPDGTARDVTPTTHITYDALGRQVAMRDADGNVNGQVWDAGGQLVKELHADGGVVTNAYDAFGDRVKLTDAMGHVTTYGYDRLGRNTRVTSAPVRVYSVDGSFGVSGGDTEQSLTTVKAYDEAGRKVGETNGNGETTRYTYDLRGNLVAAKQPIGAITRSAFDANGKQIGNQDGNGNLTTWEYDAFGLLVGHRDFQIAVSSDPLTVQQRIGYVDSTFVYDHARQLVAQGNDRSKFSDDSQSKNLHYVYDAAGQLVQIRDCAAGETTRYAYNAAGKHVWEWTSADAGTEANGSPVVQDQILAYDSLGRLAQVSGLDGVDVHFDYDAVGNRIHQSVKYDLQSVTIVPDYADVDTGQVDDAGNPITQRQQVGSHVETSTTRQSEELWFAYDVMNRQVLVDGAANGDVANDANLTATQGHRLTYDKNGNRTSDVHVGNQVWSYQPPQTGGWGVETSDSGWVEVSPDTDPNVPSEAGTAQDQQATVTLADGSTVTYTWHFHDMPARQYGHREGLVTERYAYDGMDRLTQVTTDAYDQGFAVVGPVTLESRRYDAASRVVEAGPEGALTKEWVHELTQDATNAVSEKTRVSVYDANGRLSKQLTKNADGSQDSVLEYANGEHSAPWEWTTDEPVQAHNADGSPKVDAAGNPVWEISTDGTGKPAVDAAGNPIYVQQVDAKGNPVFDTQGNPVYVQQVDAQGNPVFDADGNPVYVQQRWKTIKVPHRADGGYDGAGNVKAYRTTGGGLTSYYHYSQLEYDGYREGSVAGYRDDNQDHPGVTTSRYDANGFLVGVQDATKPANDRTFVNDTNGHVLLKRQVEAQGENQVVHFLRQLVVDGNVLAVYGAGTDPKKPATDQNDPRFDNAQGNFDLNYQPITTGYPGPAAGQYTVRGGDTLKTIAQSAYGDVSLWYLIADANGLRGDQDLRIGETLVVPNRVGGAHNTADTFKPYDPSKVVGDTTPNLPVPQASGGGGGCGALGIILTIVIVVVAVAVTVYTAGLATAALGPALGSVGAAVAGGAIGGAVGSLVSQGLSMAVGLQKDFSWNQVALGALAGGVGAGVGQAFNAVGLTAEAGTAGEWALAGARSAVSSAATQGIAVVTGLQHDFSWRSVAASAVGAGVGAAVGQGVGAVMKNVDSIGDFGKGLITGTISGFAAGATVAAMRGGRVDVVRVAADAFGNALGNSTGELALKTQQEMLQEKAQREADAESLTLRLGGKRASDVQNYQLRASGMLLTDEDLRSTANANPAAVDDKLIEEQMRAEAGGGGRDVVLLADASDVLARLGLGGEQTATDAPSIDLTDPRLGFFPPVDDGTGGNAETGVATEQGPADRVRELAGRLSRGDRGDDVRELQRLLGVRDDGIFGKGTERALNTYLSVGAAPHSPLYSAVDVGVIAVHEGGNLLSGYVPVDRAGNPIGNSGVTIGIGVDLGQQMPAGLLGMGVPQALVDRLTPYMGSGVRREDAVAALAANPLTLTVEEGHALNDSVLRSYFNSTARSFNAANQSGFENFAALPGEAQTVIADLAYNLGALSTAAPNFWHQVTTGQWNAAYQNLMDFTNSQTNPVLYGRAQADAAILQRALQSGALH